MKYGPKLTDNERTNLTILRDLVDTHIIIKQILHQNAANPRSIALSLDQLLLDDTAMSIRKGE